MLNKFLTYSIGLIVFLTSCDSKDNQEFRKYKAELNKKIERDLDYNLGWVHASFKHTIRRRGEKPSELELLEHLNRLDQFFEENEKVSTDQVEARLVDQFGDYYKDFRENLNLDLLDTIYDSTAYKVIKKLIQLKILNSYYSNQVSFCNLCFDMIEEFVTPNILNPCLTDTLVIQKFPAISKGHCSGFPYAEIEYEGEIFTKIDLGCAITIPPDKHKPGWNHWSANLHIYERYSDTIIPISGSYYVK